MYLARRGDERGPFVEALTVDARKEPGAPVRGAPAQRAVGGARVAAADLSVAVEEVLRGLDRLEGVASAQGADVRSLGLVRCARDAVQSVRERHRRGAFKNNVRRRSR